MKFVLVTAILVGALLPGTSSAQSPTSPQQPAAPAQPPQIGFVCNPRQPDLRRFSGFSIYDENDSFPLAGGDKDYTQALRVSVSYDRRALPCWVQKAGQWQLWGGEDGFRTGLSLVLGQNLYTPDILTTRNLVPDDRGFADFNYVGAELSLISEAGNIRHTFEGLIGALGVAALGNGAQGGLHALKSLGNMPKGWDSTSPNGPGAYLRYRLERRFGNYPKNPWIPDVDFTGGPALELGNVRSSAAAHGAARFGWNLTGFPATPVGPGFDFEDPGSFEFGVMAGWESRGVLNTSLVRSTPGTQDFSAESLVHDLRFGAFFRMKSLHLAYMRVERSGEYAIAGQRVGAHRFGSAQVTYTPSKDRGADGVSKWLVRDIVGELGMGRNFGGPKLGTGSPGGVTAQLAFRKGLFKGFDAGAESIVVTVESEPTPGEPGNMSDLFLRQQLVTLGWSKEARFARFGVRAGVPVTSNARIQTIYHPVVDGSVIEVEDDKNFNVAKGGFMAGLQIFPRIERHLTIGLDVSYHRMKVEEPMPNLVSPNFVKAIVLLRLQTR
jgi:hypothetical protein